MEERTRHFRSAQCHMHAAAGGVHCDNVCLHDRQECNGSCVTHAHMLSHVYECKQFSTNPKGKVRIEHRGEGWGEGGNNERKVLAFGYPKRSLRSSPGWWGQCCFVALLAHVLCCAVLLHVQQVYYLNPV